MCTKQTFICCKYIQVSCMCGFIGAVRVMLPFYIILCVQVFVYSCIAAVSVLNT